jgi:TonB family protein
MKMARWSATFLAAVLLAAPALAAENTENTEDNPGQRIDRLYQACLDKNAEACADLADAYIFGDGVSYRQENALQFLSPVCAAAEKKEDNPCRRGAAGLACRRLAEMYANGEGVKKDALLAAGYFRMASVSGDAASTVALSKMLSEGKGLPRDAARAATQMRRACDQKDFLSAQCGLKDVAVAAYSQIVTDACAAASTSGVEPAEWTADENELTPRVGKKIREPKRIHFEPPAYPQRARDARRQGRVVLETVIGIDGRVARFIGVKTSDEWLTEAALDAVKKWRYSPTLLYGIPVPVIMTITVTFKLS